MKQQLSTYSISGSTVTLTGVNRPLESILLIANATAGTILYSAATGGATAYTQGANSAISLSVAPASTDRLQIFYDDGVASANAPSSVSVNNFPSSTEISNDVGNPIPISAASLPLPTGAAQDGTDGMGITAPTGGSGIRGWLSGIYQKLSNALAVTQSGTWSIGRTWTLGSATDSVAIQGGNSTAVKVDGSAAIQLGSGVVTATTQRVTLASDGPEVTNSTAIKNSVANIPAKGAATTANSTPVNIASDQTVPISAASLPLPTGAAQDGTDGTGITPPTGGSGIRGWLSGIYNRLTLGSKTAANSLPVAIATDQIVSLGAALASQSQPVALATDQLVPLGQATMANSQPVVIASNQSAVPTTVSNAPTFSIPSFTSKTYTTTGGLITKVTYYNGATQVASRNITYSGGVIATDTLSIP